MATITGLTAEKMLEIEGASIVEGEVIGGNLILTTHDGTEINAGSVQGPAGPVGPQGPSAVVSIPGEVKLWPGSTLPVQATYGKWVWADGGVYPVATYPIAAGHIATAWRTAHGQSDPGGSNFRVPDLRGLTPVGLDAMPGGSRANRMTRAIAITLAGRAGEETHVITLPEMASHGHGVNETPHNHDVTITYNSGFNGGNTAPGGKRDGPDSYYWDTITSPGAATGRSTGISIQAAGGNGAHENVQPSVFVPYIVRLDG